MKYLQINILMLSVMALVIWIKCSLDNQDCHPDFFEKADSNIFFDQVFIDPIPVPILDTMYCGYTIKFLFWVDTSLGNKKEIFVGKIYYNNDAIYYQPDSNNLNFKLFDFSSNIDTNSRLIPINRQMLEAKQLGFHYKWNCIASPKICKLVIYDVGFLYDHDDLTILASKDYGIVGVYISYRKKSEIKKEYIISYIGDILIFNQDLNTIMFERFYGYE
jgi:hypothetical protein